MQIIEIETSKLKPYDKNAKTHPDEQVQLIANSIKEFGWRTPIVVDENFVIIQGHGRRLAAQKLGIEKVPCVIADDMSKEQVKMLRLADNKVAESEWDMALLDEELAELNDIFELDDFGFEFEVPNDYDEDEADTVPEVEDNPCIKLGDLIELGEHRLLCGDSTKEEDVVRLMDGKKADMVFTDPPYNVAIEGKAGTIKNDDMSSGLFYSFLLDAYKNYFNIMRAGACIYVAHADIERINFTQAFKDSGLKLSQVLIWNKHSATLSRQDYNWKHEPILYGWKEGDAHYFCNDFTETTVYSQKDKYDLKKMKKEELITLVKEITREYGNTVIDNDRPTISDLHPTMKPVELVQHFIQNSSEQGWIIVDLFGGAGSTLIASVTSKRISYSMELDEKYAQVIIQRYCDYTGVDTIKINGEDVSWNEYREKNTH